VPAPDHPPTVSGTLELPEPDEGVPATSESDLDAALATLRARAPTWNLTDLPARIALIDELIETTLDAAALWATVEADAKGVPSSSPLRGEDYGSGPVTVLRNLALLRRTLTQIERTGRPQPPGIDVRRDGQVAVKVLPADPLDRLLFAGFEAEVRLQPGVTQIEAEARMGRIYRPGYVPTPQVALVLGAGNVSSIAPMDVLYQLFALDRVVLLKMNRVNEYLGPHLGEALAPLVREGFLRIAYGGRDVGRYLTDHDEVDAIHVTGTDKTYDAIVFGTGAEGAARKERGEPRLDKPVSAELGNVTPVIVVPGPWSDRDLAFQAENIASMLAHNAGFNCVAARVIVQHRAWAKRRALLEAIRSSLRVAEQRHPFYPGARERWSTFVDAYGHAEVFGSDEDGDVPFTLIPELEPDSEPDLAFRAEAFCSVMAEVALDTPRSIPDYLDDAVRFCNERLWGDLTVAILVHPRSLSDAMVADALERAIDRLEYGSVVINHYPGAAYAFVSPAWGGYPGGEPTDVGSGVGVVHNSFLLEDVQKSVVRGPFRPPTKPLWFHTNPMLSRAGPMLAEVIATGSLRQLPRVLFEAARG
jgi:acyl-CoA reductase-like NAD-dependent aldehyde dehydrogenase